MDDFFDDEGVLLRRHFFEFFGRVDEEIDANGRATKERHFLKTLQERLRRGFDQHQIDIAPFFNPRPRHRAKKNDLLWLLRANQCPHHLVQGVGQRRLPLFVHGRIVTQFLSFPN